MSKSSQNLDGTPASDTLTQTHTVARKGGGSIPPCVSHIQTLTLMTKNDFLGICWECEVDPNLVVEVPAVVDLLKRDKGNPRIENQLLLHDIINANF